MTKTERDNLYKQHAIEAFKKAYSEGCILESPIERELSISLLPTVIWKERKLKSIKCVNPKHEADKAIRNVPESVLWCIISLDKFRCSWCLVRG